MQPLLLLKQTLEAQGDPGPLLLDGPNVRFTEAGQLLSRKPPGAVQQTFSVTMALTSGETLEVKFAQEKERGGFGLVDMGYKDDSTAFSVTPEMSHNEIVRILPEPWREFPARLSKEGRDLQWVVKRDRCFFVFDLDGRKVSKRPVVLGPPGISPSGLFVPHLQRLLHLPGLRGNPRRTYPKSATGPMFPGTFDAYVASLIARWQDQADQSRLHALGSALEDMGLTWKVQAKPVDDTQVELRVGRLVHSRRGGAHDLVSIADVGFGLSQSLPVVLALVAAEPGQVVYIEQPEIHLHPNAQRRLAHVISGAASRGVVVIVETHSALILREIQILAARDELSSADVGLHWFTRADDGTTTIESALLDDRGAYGAWPVDFDNVELDADRTYLDAVEAREAGQ